MSSYNFGLKPGTPATFSFNLTPGHGLTGAWLYASTSVSNSDDLIPGAVALSGDTLNVSLTADQVDKLIGPYIIVGSNGEILFDGKVHPLTSSKVATSIVGTVNGQIPVWNSATNYYEPRTLAASEIAFTAAGTIASTDVQAAISEVAAEGRNSTTLFLPAFGRSFTILGTAGGSSIGRFPSIQYPDGADQQTILSFDEEDLRQRGWSTYSVELLHSNSSTLGGDIVVTINTSAGTVGAALNAVETTLVNAAVITLPATDSVLGSYTVGTGLSVTQNALRQFNLLRSGGAVADTYAAAWHVLGWRLTRVT